MDNQTNLTNDTTGEMPRYFTSLPEILREFAPAALYLDRILSPIWYLIGFTGNPIVAIIWLGRKTRTNNSSAIYVGTLAIIQTFFLFLHLIMELNYTWDVPVHHYKGICELFNVLVMFPQYMTPLLVLAFTVERYIAINHPFKKEKLCTVRRAIYVSVVLCIFSAALSSAQAFIWSYDSNSQTCVFAFGEKVAIFEKVWTLTTETLLFFIVPICVLIINILVIIEIRHVTSQGPMAFQNNSSNSGIPTLTISLLSVSFYLICTLIPASVVYALQTVMIPNTTEPPTKELIESDPSWQRFINYYSVRKIVEEICLSNYASYFFIYCITGPQFRREVIKLLGLRKFLKKARKRRFSTTVSERSEYTLISSKSRTETDIASTQM